MEEFIMGILGDDNMFLFAIILLPALIFFAIVAFPLVIPLVIILAVTKKHDKSDKKGFYIHNPEKDFSA